MLKVPQSISEGVSVWMLSQRSDRDGLLDGFYFFVPKTQLEFSQCFCNTTVELKLKAFGHWWGETQLDHRKKIEFWKWHFPVTKWPALGYVFSGLSHTVQYNHGLCHPQSAV